MSLPLKDIRSKVSVETWALIRGMAVAQNKDDSEVIRDVLDRWAKEISHASTVADRLLQVEGVSGHRRE